MHSLPSARAFTKVNRTTCWRRGRCRRCRSPFISRWSHANSQATAGHSPRWSSPPALTVRCEERGGARTRGATRGTDMSGPPRGGRSTLESATTPQLAHPVMRSRPAHISRDKASTRPLPPPPKERPANSGPSGRPRLTKLTPSAVRHRDRLYAEEGQMLLGRHAECEVLDGALADVRAGRSRVVVLRGEAGSGKSALLDYLSGRVADWRIANAVGVESEMELAYSGLHQLCA